MSGGAVESLRDRKKRATREAIAVVARELFDARGFDAVRVSEIAVAANVSEKTVFNHFATKEDLVFIGGQAWLDALLASLRDRGAGVSIVDVFRDSSWALLDVVRSGDLADQLAIPRIVAGSELLQERLAVKWERENVVIAAAIARSDDDMVAAAVARSLAWIHRIVVRDAFAALIDGDDPKKVAARVRRRAEKAYAQLEAGLEGYGAA